MRQLLSKPWAVYALLIVATLAAVWPGLGGLGIFYGDEVFYIDWSASLFESRNGLIRVHDGMLHFAKPPLYNWLVAVAYKIFGVSLYSARLPSALAAATIVCLVYWWAYSIYREERTAFVAALATLSSYIFYQHARLAISDMVMSLGVLVACLFWLRAASSPKDRMLNLFAASLGVGLAGAVKGHVGIVVASMPLVSFTLLDRSEGRIPLKTLLNPIVWGPGLLLSIVWYVLILNLHLPAIELAPLHPVNNQSVSAAFIEYFTSKEIEARPAGGFGNLLRNIFFYPVALIRVFFPWSLIALAGLFGARRLVMDSKRYPRENKMFVSMIVPLLLLFMFVIRQQTRLRYLLPATPAIAILAARFLTLRLQAGKHERLLRPLPIALSLLLAYNTVLIGVLPGLFGRPVEDLCAELRPLLKNEDRVYFAGFESDWHTYGMAMLAHPTAVLDGNGGTLADKLKEAKAQPAQGDLYLMITKKAWLDLPEELRPGFSVVKEVETIVLPRHSRDYKDALQGRLARNAVLLLRNS